MDNLQDVLVEEGQGGKGQKIQEDSAAKTIIMMMMMMMMIPDKHGYGGVEGMETKGCWTDFVSHFNLKITGW